MKIIIEIDCNNSAFHDNNDYKYEDAAVEAEVILRTFLNQARQDLRTWQANLYDTNGNKCGSVKFEE